MVVNRLLTGMIVLLGVCFLHMLVQHLRLDYFQISSPLKVQNSLKLKIYTLKSTLLACIQKCIRILLDLCHLSPKCLDNKKPKPVCTSKPTKKVYTLIVYIYIYQPKRPNDQQPPWTNPPSPKQPQPEPTVGGEVFKFHPLSSQTM